VRTTVTKIGFGLIAGAILTTMAIGTGSAAEAAQPSGHRPGHQYSFGAGYDYYGSQPTYRSAPRQTPARTAPARTAPAGTTPAGTAPATSAPAAAPASAGSPAGQVLAQINNVRAAAGAKPLTMNSKLVASGRAHDLMMAGGCGLSHQCSGEANAGSRISAQGLNWNSYAENIGYGGPVAATDAAQATMAMKITQDMINEVAPNDGHRRNILNASLGQIGIDIYRDANGTVWMTQDFAN
jgi:uncharacterized protein YkwD